MASEFITKYIKNTTTTLLSTQNGEYIPPGKIIPVDNNLFFDILKDGKILQDIKDGKLLVSGDGVNFLSDPNQGYLYFLNRFDHGGQLIYNNNIIDLYPSIRRDPDTGVLGTSLALALFQILRDFYNDPQNPLYTGPSRECMYWDNVPKLKETVSYIKSIIKQNTYKRPKRIIIQDGSHSKQHLLKFDIIIFKQNSTLIDEIKAIKPSSLLFGLVDATRSLTNFTTDVNAYSDKLDGYYISKTGYNYGTVSTNNRVEFNKRVDLVHSLNKIIMIDTININHISGNINDVNYPNATWNPNLIESTINEGDYYLINNFVINNGEFINKSEWLQYINKTFQLRKDRGINLCALCNISQDDTDEIPKYTTCCMTAAICALEAVGLVSGNFHERPENALIHTILWDAYPILIEEDGYIRRYLEGATVSVDFSNNYNHSIEVLL